MHVSFSTSSSSDSEQHPNVVHAASYGQSWQRKAARGYSYIERKMGDTELSYFLPSRQTGVNDMYLHLGFRSPQHLVTRSRVKAVWALLRLRHPLLCATAEMHDYDDVRFVFSPPDSVDEALSSADLNLEFRSQSKDELIDSYLNGPRTLSNSRLSYLILSERASDSLPTPPLTPVSSVNGQRNLKNLEIPSSERQYELLICAMHFLGDGMALHQFANDFFGLLGNDKTEEELHIMLSNEWHERYGESSASPAILPPALEARIPVESNKLHRVVSQIDFQLSQQKLLGGQSFPRRKHPERRTVVPTLSFSEDRTRTILRKCKTNGVSISAALFAICNIAWLRMGKGGPELPVLMYSALNLRPYFTIRQPSPWDSYWFLAIGYFNVVLPNFLPDGDKTVEATFWHRARKAKDQSIAAAKNPMLISRTRELARERSERAQRWAREDDEKDSGVWVPPPPATTSPEPREPIFPKRAEAPSTALIGLSLLGNLDGIYKHSSFPAIRLHTLTTGSRQRHGAMLLFGYTFAGKLWLSLGYDQNGFAEGVVEKFWEEAIKCVDEFL